jgi:hypothetical protein
MQEGAVLLAGNFFLTMLANFRPLFDNLGTKRALPGKKSLVNLGYGFIDFFLENLIAECHVSDRLDGFQFTDISNHFSGFYPNTYRLGYVE